MFVDHKTMQLINSLRRKQSIGRTGGWDKIMELADPGVSGLLMQCKSSGISMPIVGYEIQGSDDAVVAELELAWPPKKIGVAISEDDKLYAEKHGWEVWIMVEALENYLHFKTCLLRSYY
ncbi:MAG: hypothetical protein JMN25_14100 [gamma proteobacterium endosymbiont of Lamellibrachia anaximandri]|nr:hypothetical protein [gamma proteobacterium endosymbiont of Lamellibrachia anaximandri]